MAVLGIILGLLVPGGGLAFAVWKLGAAAVFGGIGKRLKAAAGWAADHWKVVLPVLIASAALAYILILRGDLRHERKVNGQQAALLAAVKSEVDRGVGKPTEAVDAPFYVRRFVDNVVTLKGALDRQSAALAVAKADANAHVAAAHEAAKPTQAQQTREVVRRQLADPARSDGLTAKEWGQL